jgi:hypothetical protein
MKRRQVSSDRKADAESVRFLLTELIRSSHKSRSQIAEEMTRLLGERVTERMLNSYTSGAAEKHRWPAQYDIALCEVLEDFSLLAARVNRAGFRMIGPEEERLIEIGRAYVAKARAEKKLAEVAL